MNNKTALLSMRMVCLIVLCLYLSPNIICSRTLVVPPYSGKKANEIKKIKLKKKIFTVEIADTRSKRLKGLMHKKKLPENKGMYFVFPQELIVPIWMKNTYIALDVIWINKDMRVVEYKENMMPLDKTVVYPNAKAMYVLEINAGLIQALNIRVGDRVKDVKATKTFKNNKDFKVEL
jgi:uncharacterized protein